MQQKSLFKQRTKLNKQRTIRQKKSNSNVNRKESIKGTSIKIDKTSSADVSQKHISE